MRRQGSGQREQGANRCGTDSCGCTVCRGVDSNRSADEADSPNGRKVRGLRARGPTSRTGHANDAVACGAGWGLQANRAEQLRREIEDLRRQELQIERHCVEVQVCAW